MIYQAYGGTSTFIREMVKRYEDLDIAVVCKNCEFWMAREIQKYCRLYVWKQGNTIKCNVCIINYDSSICDYVDGDIYMVFHADYSCPMYKQYPALHPKIKGYISITNVVKGVVKEMFKIDSILSYNPNNIKRKDRLVLVSATRLSKIKGKARMQALGDELNRQGIRYIWYVFTDDGHEINNPNIIYMKPIERDVEGRPDILDWVSEADYVVQLSDSEALSYTIQDSVQLGTPLIVTPLPYLDEVGIKDGENCYILNFECSNVADVVKKMKKKPKFTYEPLKDSYDKILYKNPSHYAHDHKETIEVRSIYEYDWDDIDKKCKRKKGDTWFVSPLRLYELYQNKYELIEETGNVKR